GDAISVVVEFDAGFERDDVFGGGAGESLQIQYLAAGDDVEHAADPLQVGGRKFQQQRQAVLNLFQQQPLGGRGLLFGEFAEIQRCGGFAQDARTQLLQCVEPLRQRDNFGIGDGV